MSCVLVALLVAHVQLHDQQVVASRKRPGAVEQHSWSNHGVAAVFKSQRAAAAQIAWRHAMQQQSWGGQAKEAYLRTCLNAAHARHSCPWLNRDQGGLAGPACPQDMQRATNAEQAPSHVLLCLYVYALL